MPRWNLTPKERFLIKLSKDGLVPVHCPELGPCWVWTEAKMTSGYGVFYLNGKQIGAHRAAYILFTGDIPEGMDIDHLCHSGDGSCTKGKDCPHRLCVNPAHLKPATRLQNLARGNTFVA